MGVLKVLGEWLNKSGWTYLLAAADVTTEARVENLLQGSHVSRCQWAHQVTAAALYKLMCSSYEEYKGCGPDQSLNFPEWCSEGVANYPQFSYWYKTFQLELLFLSFLWAQREQNYQDYVVSLMNIAHWMFALDHFHYSQWMAFHLTDLLSLSENCKEVHE